MYVYTITTFTHSPFCYHKQNSCRSPAYVWKLGCLHILTECVHATMAITCQHITHYSTNGLGAGWFELNPHHVATLVPGIILSLIKLISRDLLLQVRQTGQNRYSFTPTSRHKACIARWLGIWTTLPSICNTQAFLQ